MHRADVLFSHMTNNQVQIQMFIINTLMKRFIHSMSRKHLIYVFLLAVIGFSSCKDQVDDSDMYTFTGETAYSFCQDNPDYTNFAYILSRVKLSKKSDSELSQLLSARGNFTVFAPTNDAIQHYLDSIYETPNFDITQITDSVADYIARNSIIDCENDEAYQTTDFFEGALEKTNMDDRYITIEFDTTANGKLVTKVNTRSRIIQGDIEVTNGYIHGIDAVLQLSRATLPSLIQEANNLYIFNEILKRTGWADSMKKVRDEDYELNHEEWGRDLNGNPSIKNPEHRYSGYTAFVETDSIFHEQWGIPMPVTENGILQNTDEIMQAITAKCQQAYPDATNSDLKSQDNAVNRFVAYHLISTRIPWDKLVFHHVEMGYAYAIPDQLSINCYEYYETMGKNRWLIKLTEGKSTDGKRINRKSTYDLDNYNELDVTIPGTLIKSTNGSNLTNSINGFYYPIDSVLVYSNYVPGIVLNERLRWDTSSLLSELITNGYRGISSSGQFPFPNGYFERLEFSNESRCVYLPYQAGASQSNYQADEMNIRGQYDLIFRLPPVPNEGTYELRVSAPCNTGFGMAQFYFGSNKDNLMPVGLPVDLRVDPAGPVIGYEADTKDTEHNEQNDKDMRNRGYMKPPKHDGVAKGGAAVTEDCRNTTSYRANVRLRKIVWTGNVKPTDVLYIRMKSLLENTNACFLLDLIEWCPKQVYNSAEGEDKW